MGEDAMPPLGGTRRDSAVAVFKGCLGAFPFVGSILAEIVGQLIPQQRSDRLEQYAVLLHQRLSTLEEAELKVRMQNPENVDLFEEGAFQSVRALTKDRIEYIINLVAHGIAGDAKHRLQSKRLLNLLRDLDDAQIIVLASHLVKHEHDGEFWSRHSAILDVVIATLTSKQAEIDEAEIQQLATDQLIKLGLLQPRFTSVRRGELPEFDARTGMMKTGGRPELTRLGLLVLREVGLAEEQDY